MSSDPRPASYQADCATGGGTAIRGGGPQVQHLPSHRRRHPGRLVSDRPERGQTGAGRCSLRHLTWFFVKASLAAALAFSITSWLWVLIGTGVVTLTAALLLALGVPGWLTPRPPPPPQAVAPGTPNLTVHAPGPIVVLPASVEEREGACERDRARRDAYRCRVRGDPPDGGSPSSRPRRCSHRGHAPSAARRPTQQAPLTISAGEPSSAAGPARPAYRPRHRPDRSHAARP